MGHNKLILKFLWGKAKNHLGNLEEGEVWGDLPYQTSKLVTKLSFLREPGIEDQMNETEWKRAPRCR